jgi:hypothetical protein
MQPVLELMAELELLTWDEARETSAHLANQETFSLLHPALQRKVWMAQVLLNWEPEDLGVTLH